MGSGEKASPAPSERRGAQIGKAGED